jgi:hypothetical protein
MTTKNKKVRKYTSPVLKKLEEEMKNDPWYVKLKLWFNLQKWVLMCRTRKYWDKTYQHYIFRKNED